jgi:hypothetical protein
MKAPSHTPEEIHAATRAQYQRLADAMRMVREAVETSMGAASGLAASEQFETAYHECEAIAHAIARFAETRVNREPVNTMPRPSRRHRRCCAIILRRSRLRRNSQLWQHRRRRLA